MRTIIVACAALVASASAVLAADAAVTPGPFYPPPAFPRGEPAVYPGPFDPPPAFPLLKHYNWTGFYAGLNAGGAFGRTAWTSIADTNPVTGAPLTATTTMSGGLAGVTAGYNLQAGDPLVVGAEADLDWSGLKSTLVTPACTPGCQVKNPWLSTIRLRIGWGFETVMPYVTGGVALGELSGSIVGTGLGTDSQNTLGWTVGAGAEFVIAGGLHAKAEYLYVDLGGFSCNTCGALSAIPPPAPVSARVTANVARVGLSYQFDIGK
jgi:outer membrane immunogenic protein